MNLTAHTGSARGYGARIPFTLMIACLCLASTEACHASESAIAPVPSSPNMPSSGLLQQQNPAAAAEVVAIRTPAATGDTLRLMQGAANPVSIAWVSRTGLSRALQFRVEVSNSWASTDAVYPLSSAAWQYGGQYDETAILPIPPFSVAGHGVLRVTLIDSVDGALQSTEVARFPCFVPASVSESPIAKEKVLEYAGPLSRSLRAACRLFPGMGVDLPIAPNDQTPAYGMVVFSAIRFSAEYSQGEPVLECDLIAAGGSVSETVRLLAGVHTSLAEYDAPRPGVLHIRKAPVFSATPYTGVDWQGKPFPIYLYAATIGFSSPLTPASIRLRQCGATGAVDVLDVLLLTGTKP